MRLIVCIILLFGAGFKSNSQTNDQMLWAKIGIEGKIIKKLSWSGEINSRFGSTGLETFFPEAGLEYKLLKWFRPSIQYRYIIDKNKYGNYKTSSRISFNGNFKSKVERFNLGLRVRYQYSFNQINTADKYAIFEHGFRLKPSVEYRIKGSKFTPLVSSEFFYRPKEGNETVSYRKLRFSVGTKYKFNSSHRVAVKYQLNKKFRAFTEGSRHVLAVSYVYSL